MKGEEEKKHTRNSHGPMFSVGLVHFICISLSLDSRPFGVTALLLSRTIFLHLSLFHARAHNLTRQSQVIASLWIVCHTVRCTHHHHHHHHRPYRALLGVGVCVKAAFWKPFRNARAEAGWGLFGCVPEWKQDRWDHSAAHTRTHAHSCIITDGFTQRGVRTTPSKPVFLFVFILRLWLYSSPRYSVHVGLRVFFHRCSTPCPDVRLCVCERGLTRSLRQSESAQIR